MRKLFIIEAERDGIDCGYCPFADTRCGADKESRDLLEEVWAEEHGYVKKEDPINPDHYKAGKLQTIEQMMIVFGPTKVAGFCEVNAFKYHARAGLKGDAVMDHKKADWYMRLYDRLKVFGCMDSENALVALRDFLKEEESTNENQH